MQPIATATSERHVYDADVGRSSAAFGAVDDDDGNTATFSLAPFGRA
jgi:hypothetical protein